VLVDHRPLDLKGRRQLAVGLREVALQDLEALDLRDPREARVTASTSSWRAARTRTSCAIVARSAASGLDAVV
jgi:hypothetical protein